MPLGLQQRNGGQAPITQQTQPPVPGQPSPSQAGGPSAPIPGTVPTAPAAALAETRETALGAEPARQHRYARHPRLDQPARRAPRRHRPQELPRDRRSAQPEHRSVLAVGQPEPALRRVRLGRRRARRVADRRHRLDRRRPDPDARRSGGVSPGTTARGSSSGARSASTRARCSQSATWSRTGRGRPSRCIPTGSSPVTASRPRSAITFCTRA